MHALDSNINAQFSSEYEGASALYKLLEFMHIEDPLFLPRTLLYRHASSKKGTTPQIIPSLALDSIFTNHNNHNNLDKKPYKMYMEIKGQVLHSLPDTMMASTSLSFTIISLLWQQTKIKSDKYVLIHIQTGVPIYHENKRPVFKTKCNIDKKGGHEIKMMLFAVASSFDLRGFEKEMKTRMMEKGGFKKNAKQLRTFKEIPQWSWKSQMTWSFSKKPPSGSFGLYAINRDGHAVEEMTCSLRLKYSGDAKNKAHNKFTETKISSAVVNMRSGPDSNSTTPSVYLHYGFNAGLRRRTEITKGMVCPWCNLNGTTLEGFLSHLVTSHDHFHFFVQLADDGTLHVHVNRSSRHKGNGNSKFDSFVFLRPCGSSPYPYGKTSGRSVTAPCFEKVKPPFPRTYYRVHTGFAIEQGDADFDSDDDDHEPRWYLKYQEELLDDFEDIRSLEKNFYKKWNQFTFTRKIKADLEVASVCIDFATQEHEWISKMKMRKVLLTHYFMLWDYGTLQPEVIAECMKIVDAP